jgi:hypothetical protein
MAHVLSEWHEEDDENEESAAIPDEPPGRALAFALLIGMSREGPARWRSQVVAVHSSTFNLQQS